MSAPAPAPRAEGDGSGRATGLARLRRLWQPRRGLFWLMLTFNLLSSLCAWALRTLPLSPAGAFLIGTVALLNVGFGLAAAWALLRDEPPKGPGGGAR